MNKWKNMPGIKQYHQVYWILYLFGHKSIIVLVHSPEYFLNVSFLAKELLKGQSSIRVFVKNLEEPIYLSPYEKKGNSISDEKVYLEQISPRTATLFGYFIRYFIILDLFCVKHWMGVERVWSNWMKLKPKSSKLENDFITMQFCQHQGLSGKEISALLDIF